MTDTDLMKPLRTLTQEQAACCFLQCLYAIQNVYQEAMPEGDSERLSWRAPELLGDLSEYEEGQIAGGIYSLTCMFARITGGGWAECDADWRLSKRIEASIEHEPETVVRSLNRRLAEDWQDRGKAFSERVKQIPFPRSMPDILGPQFHIDFESIASLLAQQAFSRRKESNLA